ncbi:MAG: hypothetical protein ACRD3E_05995, partial [Terriglobales bacterium]
MTTSTSSAAMGTATKGIDRVSVSSAAPGTRPVVLISNVVMHYRVSVYNYFHKRFRDAGYEFSVLTDRLQGENQRGLDFSLQEVPFRFSQYKRALSEIDPAAVIIFLHLKDRVLWPLIHWLKWKNIPFAFWTKGGNCDAKGSCLRHELFNYVHACSDALILYADSCRSFIKKRYQS